MKTKVTKKEIRNNYNNIIGVGYCNLQHLLRHKEASYYSAGAYGWSCDYYIIDNDTIISTGYKPISTTEVSYKTCDKYEGLAHNITNKNLDYDKQQQEFDKLLQEFVAEILG